MLGGVAPILIFNFPYSANQSNPLFNALSGVPLVGAELANFSTEFGIPIPLYLDERLTGLYVESESKAVDIESTTEPQLSGKPPLLYQRLLNSSVTVNMLCRQDSLFLAAFLALSEVAIPRLASLNYRISYMNGATVVLNALLGGITVVSGSDDDLMRIALTLHKVIDTQRNPFTTVAPVNGTTLQGPTGVAGKVFA